MKKNNKEKCKHGNSPVYMQGCPHCCTTAMRMLNVCNDNDFDGRTLHVMLCNAYDDVEAFKAAVAKAKQQIAEHDAREKP